MHDDEGDGEAPCLTMTKEDTAWVVEDGPKIVLEVKNF